MPSDLGKLHKEEKPSQDRILVNWRTCAPYKETAAIPP